MGTLALAGLLVVGCSASEQSPYKEYLQGVKSSVPSAGVSDELFIRLGVDICRDLDNDRPVMQIIGDGIDAGIAPSTVGGIIAEAILHICPDQKQKVLDSK